MGSRDNMRSMKELNLELYNPNRVEGWFNIPTIEEDYFVPKKMISFHEILSYDGPDYYKCVHFYLSDIMFQRIWNKPANYVNMLRKFDGILSPDFSVFRDMPVPVQLYNVYRNRLIGQYLQTQGIRVIPTVSWGEPKTYKFCFDGFKEGSIVSVASTGVIGKQDNLDFWYMGMQELIKRKHPRTILFYGNPIPFDYGNAEVLCFVNRQVDKFGKHPAALKPEICAG